MGPAGVMNSRTATPGPGIASMPRPTLNGPAIAALGWLALIAVASAFPLSGTPPTVALVLQVATIALALFAARAADLPAWAKRPEWLHLVVLC